MPIDGAFSGSMVRIGLALLLGWLTGSLVNYLGDVLPRRRRLVRPFCLACEAPQPWAAVILPGRCAACHSGRAGRAWLVWAAFLGAGLWMLLAPPERLGSLLGLFWLAFFGLVIVIDMEHYLILHPVSLFGIAAALPTGWALHGLLPTLIGGAAGAGIMYAFYRLGFLFIGWLRRRQGQAIDEDIALGFGDVMLSAVLGLLLGWPGIVAGLLLAAILGGLGGLLYMLWMAARGAYRAGQAIPYGPFLALSAIYLLFFLR
ncbi:MAG: prepilin peptidase [Chloroflexota bacterium]